jgi:hypothetical protein
MISVRFKTTPDEFYFQTPGFSQNIYNKAIGNQIFAADAFGYFSDPHQQLH